MALPCSICISRFARQIDADLLDHHQSFSAIALRYGVGRQALWRHRHTHLRNAIAASEELKMLASTESLIAELNRLHAYVSDVLERGVTSRDDRLVLLGVAEGRRNVDSLVKLGALGDLASRLAAGEAMLASAMTAPSHDAPARDEQE